MNHLPPKNESIPLPNVNVAHWDESESTYPVASLADLIQLALRLSGKHQLRMRFERDSPLLGLPVDFLTRSSPTIPWTVTMSSSPTHVHVTIQIR